VDSNRNKIFIGINNNHLRSNILARTAHHGAKNCHITRVNTNAIALSLAAI